MVASQLWFLVDTLQVGVVAVDDVDAFLPGSPDRPLQRRDDSQGPVSLQRAGDGVVQHVDDEDSLTVVETGADAMPWTSATS